MFDPALAGYWGSRDLGAAAETVLSLISENDARVDGIKVSLLDAEREMALRAALPPGVRLYTGDDFNYPSLIASGSDALLGIFDAIAPAAAAALRALDDGDGSGYEEILGPTVPLARTIFEAPTQNYKTGLVFLAWLAGHQDAFVTAAAPNPPGRCPTWQKSSARGRRRPAARPRTRRTPHDDTPGPARNHHVMSAHAPPPSPATVTARHSGRSDMSRLALNQWTVRTWGLRDAVEGCARHGIEAIGLWREHVADCGLAPAAALVRDAGLRVPSLCRGGFFNRPGWLDDNRVAIDEAATLGAACLVLVVGGLPEGQRGTWPEPGRG